MDAIDRAWRLWIIAILVGMLVAIGALAFIVVPLVRRPVRGARRLHRDLPRDRHQYRQGGARCASGRPARQPRSPGPRPSSRRSSMRTRPRAKPWRKRTCIACHAVDGSSADPAIPRMAGQSAFAIYKELQDFKSGARTNDDDVADRPAAGREADGRCRRLLREPAAQGPRRARIRAMQARRSRRLVLAATPGGRYPRAPPATCAEAGGPFETPSLTGQSPPTSQRSSRPLPTAAATTTSISACGRSPRSSPRAK